MESKLANAARADLAESIRKLSPEQRLNAFLAHSTLMLALRRAAEQRRDSRRP